MFKKKKQEYVKLGPIDELRGVIKLGATIDEALEAYAKNEGCADWEEMHQKFTPSKLMEHYRKVFLYWHRVGDQRVSYDTEERFHHTLSIVQLMHRTSCEKTFEMLADMIENYAKRNPGDEERIEEMRITRERASQKFTKK